MNRRLTIIVIVVVAILAAVLATTFVMNQPAVPDGGAVDTNVGDTQPGDQDAATGPGN